ncbi:MAG TPA: GatB/YqeY domain-containing protein [Candidatus Omnitrophota bacterium]|nr:GatB/YqeY domain-containing protein [Candidatus Omnitrophota bacterium]
MNEEKREMLAKISSDLTAAMKQKEELKLSVLRMMKSKVLYVNARGDLPDAEIIKIIAKYNKELKEAVEEAKKVGRNDAAAATEKEIAVVETYLPKQLSDDEIKNTVKNAIAATGAVSAKDMGKVMKEVLAAHPGVDGKLVNQFVRELLK